MGAITKFGLSSSNDRNDTLLNYFAAFLGKSIDDCLLSASEKFDEHAIHDKSEYYGYDWRRKLRAALIALLKSIDNVHFTDANGETFLHHFLEIFLNESRRLSPHKFSIALEIVADSLDRGASVGVLDNEGFSPLQMLVDNWQEDVVKLILIKLKSICFCCVSDCQQRHLINANPLHFEATDHLLDIVQICLDNEVEISVHTSDNNNPLVTLLCKYSDITMSSNESKRLAIITRLISMGWNANAVDSSGYSALHYAAANNCVELVRYLIELGANVNYQEPTSGLASIHMASTKSLQTAPNIVVLFEAGANINVKDSRGKTPLHYATLYLPSLVRDKSVLPTLLSLGAHVNQPDDNGQLPLHNVIKARNCTALRYLIDFGADLQDIDVKCLNESWIETSEWRSGVLPIGGVHYYLLKLTIAKLLNIHIGQQVEERYKYQFRMCSEEVRKMKKYYIDGGISLYDWLRMNHSKARPFYLNGVPPELQTKFPFYYEIVKARYRMVTERIPLLEPSKLAWYQITKIDLPEICVERILFHLNNRHLRFLADNLEKEDM